MSRVCCKCWASSVIVFMLVLTEFIDCCCAAAISSISKNSFACLTLIALSSSRITAGFSCRHSHSISLDNFNFKAKSIDFCLHLKLNKCSHGFWMIHYVSEKIFVFNYLLINGGLVTAWAQEPFSAMLLMKSSFRRFSIYSRSAFDFRNCEDPQSLTYRTTPH